MKEDLLSGLAVEFLKEVPFMSVACYAVLAIMAAVHGIKANKKSFEVLSEDCALVVLTIGERCREGHSDVVVQHLDAVSNLLANIQRYMEKHSKMSPFQQLLKFDGVQQKTELFQRQLSAMSQSMQLALQFDHDAMTKAIQQDQAMLPALIQTLSFKMDAQTEKLETLVDINRTLQNQLAAFPETLHEMMKTMLQTKMDTIIGNSGRGLWGPAPWSVSADDVDIMWDSPLGKGSYGRIYKAVWNRREVAVKVMTEAHGRQAAEAIEREANIWFPLHDPNVLKLWRVCLNADEPFIVMPLMQGDLVSFLRRYPDMDIDARITFMAGIASGMQYLHELPNPIIHGDLKANNVLVDDRCQAQITDFGLSFIKSLSKSNTKSHTSATRWIAPEKYKRGYKPAPSADVFAFAMTCYEIITGRPPFVEEVHDNIVERWIIDGERPDRPEGVPDSLWTLITRCWDHEPTARPTFRQICEELSPFGMFQMPSSSSLDSSMKALGLGAKMPIPRGAITDDSGYETGVRPTTPSAAPAASLHRAASPSASPLRTAAPAALLHRASSLVASPLSTAAPAAPVRSDSLSLSVSSGSEVNSNADETANASGSNESPPDYEPLSDLQILIRAFPDWAAEHNIENTWFENPSITFDDDSNIVGLHLEDAKISGPFPGALCYLRNLKELWLYNNKISGPIPDEIGQLQQLSILYLDNNKLSGPIPASLSTLSELTMFSAANNRLSGEIPKEMGNLRLLSMLSLANNKLTGLIPREIGHLGALGVLNLSGNQLSGFIPSDIGNLTYLTELDLARNHIGGEIPRELSYCRALTELLLNNNQLTGPIPGSLSTLSHLQTLNISTNDLTGEIPALLGNLSNLRTLDLHANRLAGHIPSALGKLSRLESLILSFNRLLGSIPKELAFCNLKTLVLNNNQLIAPIPRELGTISSLVSLCLDNNGLSGSIPPTLGNLINLTELSLHSNKLTGSIPKELGNLTNLHELRLHGNQLSGPIPRELSYMSVSAVAGGA
ncbi:hypothetical protein BC831DRAFT_515021 [Entophlyctis helioformis]|nr:hypothetical protein BC831DRAFT_515021 [Entophlyctis helioformis]